jgi:hypothetical protein
MRVKLKSVICLAVIFSIAALIYSCGDAAVLPKPNSGEIGVTNLKPLDRDVEGIYEAWVSIGEGTDHGDNVYKSLGRFNISLSGNLIDSNGNNFALNLSDVPNINLTEDALITINPPGYYDTVPSNIRILGGAKTNQNGALVFNMTMDCEDILGGIAAQFPSDSGKFTLAAPTTGDTNQYYRGVWFSLDGRSPVQGLTLQNIPDTADWTYEAWVFDVRDLRYIYDMGRFDSPGGPDNNAQCGGTEPPWSLPGHDWIQSGCPGGVIPDITNLSINNTAYEVVITLEPRFEQGPALSKPFFIRLFYLRIPGPIQYGEVLRLSNLSSATLPSGYIILTANF